MKNKFTAIIGLIVVFLMGGSVAVFGANAPLDENRNPKKFGNDCNVTHSTVIAGKDVAGSLATSTGRAWARISIGDNATNTIFANFAQGATATVNTGLPLNHTSGTNGNATSTPNIDFGINTTFPYTGAVSLVAETGTTTVLATQCVFN